MSSHDYNIGTSNYSRLKISPWELWDELTKTSVYKADIIKRLLRTKEGEEELDQLKIQHVVEKLDELREYRMAKFEEIKDDLTQEEAYILYSVFVGLDYKTSFQHIFKK